MANPLAAYVNDFILNPGASIQLNDDGLEESSYGVEKQDTNSKKTLKSSKASKLRIRNEKTLDDQDEQYKGKKVLRKQIDDGENTYDPELAKYFLNADNAKEEQDNTDGSVSGHSDEERKFKSSNLKKNLHIQKNIDCKNKIQNSKLLEHESSEEGSSEEEWNGEETDEEDMDDEEEEEEFADNESFNKEEEVDDENDSGILMTSNNALSGHKSIDIKSQYAIFDSLFEARIKMQKVCTIVNQLPQYDSYPDFVNENDENFNKNIVTARKAMKKLTNNLIDLQKLIAPQTTSSDDAPEDINDEDIDGENKKSKKRKLDIYEEKIHKRYKTLLPHRDSVLMQWHEKTKFLNNKKNKANFSEFEINPVVQIQNILANEDQLIQRTQVKNVSRGNLFHVLGKNDESDSKTLDDIDPEIFDDSDFYSRMLEEFLKSKIGSSENMTHVSRQWVEIKNLRKKSKKTGIRTTKGRAIRYDVIAKLQQYMAPCKQPTMSDSAMNQLFSSLFGKFSNDVGS